jgi:hypothetical protein
MQLHKPTYRDTFLSLNIISLSGFDHDLAAWLVDLSSCLPSKVAGQLIKGFVWTSDNNIVVPLQRI